jgi:hypothetical protein
MNSQDNPRGDKPERKPVTIGELRARMICKKRYGRATLTIRRWGRLVGEDELTEKMETFRVGKASAEEVAWAFVRARVEKHSATFSWKTADRARVLALVVDCSERPVFENAEPEVVAQALVAAQDKEKAQLREFAQVFSRSFANTVNLKDLVPSGSH